MQDTQPDLIVFIIMKNFTGNRKIGIFYDGNYWTTVSNYYNFIHPLKARLNVSGLHNLIASEISTSFYESDEECYVTESHFFKNRYSAQDAKDRGNQLYYDRIVDDILMYEGVVPHYIPVRGGNIRNSEKELSVALSTRAIHTAIKNELDVVVIISSDSCYIPLLRELKSLGITVVLVSWNFENKPEEPNYKVGMTSNELIKESMLYLPMEEIISEGIKNKEEIVEAVMISRNNNTYDNIDLTIEEETTDDEDDTSTHIGEVLILKSGYGFLRHPNNNLFFHYLDVLGGFSELREGDKVEYTIGKNKDGNDVAKAVCKVIVDDDGNILQRFDTKNNAE